MGGFLAAHGVQRQVCVYVLCVSAHLRWHQSTAFGTRLTCQPDSYRRSQRKEFVFVLHLLSEVVAIILNSHHVASDMHPVAGAVLSSLSIVACAIYPLVAMQHARPRFVLQTWLPYRRARSARIRVRARVWANTESNARRKCSVRARTQGERERIFRLHGMITLTHHERDKQNA